MAITTNNNVTSGILSIPRAGNSAFAPANGIPGTATAVPNMSTPTGPKVAQNNIPGLINPTASVGPVTSQTITTKPDGTTTHKTTHDTSNETAQTQTTSGITTPPSTQVASGPTYDAQGNAIIPSGAPGVSSAPAGTPVTPQPTTPATPNSTSGAVTFPGIVGSAVSAAQGAVSTGQTQEQQGYQNYQALQAKLAAAQGQESTTLANMQGNPIPIEFQQGRGNIVQANSLAQQNALATQEQAAATSAGIGANLQGTGLGALNTAAGQTAPTGTFPFSYDPVTGTFKNSGGGVVTPAQAAQALNTGTMSPDQASAALSYLGTSAQSQLTAAMQSVNPSFNWNQASQNAQTQGTIGPQSSLATAVLQNLQSNLSKVPALQQSGNNIVNSLAALVTNSGLAGSGAQQDSQALKDSTNEARTAVSNALGTAYSTTPTAFTAMVDSWFPDDPTPAQVQAGMNEFSSLMGARSQSFSSPGTVPLPTTSTTDSSGSTTSGWGSITYK